MRILYWLYGDKNKTSVRGPLSLPPKAFALALTFGYILTWLTFSLANTALEFAQRSALVDPLITVEAGSTLTASVKCAEEVAGGGKPVASTYAACQLARKADAARFNIFKLQDEPYRKTLLQKLAAVWGDGSKGQAYMTDNDLAKFIASIDIVNAGDPTPKFPPLVPVTRDAVELKRKIAALVTGKQITDRSAFLIITGMVDYRPDFLSADEVLFEEPSKDVIAKDRVDALSLINGLIDQKKKDTFWYWRAGQALNGFIQWLTLFVAITAIFLLTIRRKWAALNSVILTQLLNHGQAPRLLLRPATQSASDWVEVNDFVACDNADRSYLPRRLVTDSVSSGAAVGSDTTARFVDTIDGYDIEVSERDYLPVKWLIDAIPTLGFLGTIYGMILAMGGAGTVVGVEGQEELKTAMGALSGNLGTAFDTTAIALVLAMVVGLFVSAARSAEADLFATYRSNARRLADWGTNSSENRDATS